MDVLQSHENGVRTLGVVGNFDTTDREAFLAYVDEAIENQCFRVLVDMEQLRFINSTAMGLLIQAQKRLKEFGGDLAVCSLPGFTAKLFKSLGIDRKIKCFEAHDQGHEYLLRIGGDGVAVPGDEEIGFVFTGEEQVAVAGDEPRMGTIATISDLRVVIRWGNEEGLDVAHLLAAGTPLHVQFRLPLFHPTHTFDARITVESADTSAAGEVMLSGGFVVLSDVERRGIQQFMRDLRLLGGDDSGA